MTHVTVKVSPVTYDGIVSHATNNWVKLNEPELTVIHRIKHMANCRFIQDFSHTRRVRATMCKIWYSGFHEANADHSYQDSWAHVDAGYCLDSTAGMEFNSVVVCDC